jgi:hypothetical protein
MASASPTAATASGPGRFATPSRSTVLASVALLGAAAYAFAIVWSGGDAMLLLPLAGAIVVLGICAHPAIGVYVLFGAAVLFEQFTPVSIVPITQTKFFVNINAYTPIPIRLSVSDLLMLLTIGALFVRRIGPRGERLRMGAFGWAVLAYVGVFALGTVGGVARGGAWNADVTLAEVRGPVQMCVAYFLAANLVRDRRQLSGLILLFVLMAAVKAVQTILSYQEASNLSYSLRTIISHEDVVFMGAAIALAFVAIVMGHRSRLVKVLLALLPLFLIAEFVANRRVGLIALAVTILAIMILGLFTHPRRAATLMAVGFVGLAAYLAAFWDATGPAAEPLRAMRSVFDPSATSLVDQYSSAWRDVEHQNIAYTISELPLTGVGVGQKYLFERQASDVPFIYWRFITHDALLWLWLKAGPLGAFALWFLVARAVLVGASLFRRVREPSLRWAVALPIALVVSQVVFSSVDLGLTYSRTMIVLGISLGLAAFVAEEHSRSSATGSSQ